MVISENNVDYDTLFATLAYVLIGAILYYLLSPNPTKPSKGLRIEDKVNWRSVNWKEKVSKTKTGKQYCIIGAGFVGKRLIHTLLLRGENKIRAFDMDPRACDVFKNDPRIEFIQGDVTNYEQVKKAINGCEVVYATFAIIRFMDNLEFQAPISYKINVLGTENVVKACQEVGGVQALIQTSTSNVCIREGQSTLGMDEKSPYVTRENSPHHYGWTKAIAEQLVLKADGIANIRTGAIRPCSAVFGADDRHLLEPMLKLGRSPLPPNGGSNVIDFVSVNNVVWGHILLEKELLANPSQVGDQSRPGGVTYFPLPEKLLIGISYLVDAALYSGLKVPPPLNQLTTATISFLDLSYAFSSKKASKSLQYEPLFSVDQALQLSVEEMQLGRMLPSLLD